MFIIALKYFVERKLANRRARLQVERELDTTTTRDLADMGLSRQDVGPISRQAGREAEAAVKARRSPELAKARAMRDIGAPPQVYY